MNPASSKATKKKGQQGTVCRRRRIEEGQMEGGGRGPQEGGKFCNGY